MLKEYTLKVTCEVGGQTDEECEEAIQRLIEQLGMTAEITHEEVVQPDEVERE